MFSILADLVLPDFRSGNDLLCKLHNPLKRLFGHEKSAIGRLPKQIPIFLKVNQKEQNFDEFWNFMSAHFGTVGSTEH